MKRYLTWLHLSDLHAHSPKSDWDAQRVLTTLCADLGHVQETFGLRPDLVFFTGDMAWGQVGKGAGQTLKEQFHFASQFFDRVRSTFVPEVEKSNLFLVPGNHDVNREEVTQDQWEWLDRQTELFSISDLIGRAQKQWQRYVARLRDYLTFLEENQYLPSVLDRERLVYAQTIRVAGIDLGVAGFNSAWSCCREFEYGLLRLGGKWQHETLYSALQRADLRGDHASSLELVQHLRKQGVRFVHRKGLSFPTPRPRA